MTLKTSPNLATQSMGPARSICGWLPYSKCLSLSLSGVTGYRFGCSSKLRIASLNPRYHFRAAPESSASIRVSSVIAVAMRHGKL